MRAAFYTRHGSSEVLTVGEQPTPQPACGEVRVRVRASGVNPSDWKSRKGGPGRKLAGPLVIPHCDGAGDIDAVGEGVPAGRIGERVWMWNAQWQRPFGTAAEYVCLPSAQAAPLPDVVSYEEGACLGVPALTAMQAVRLADAGPGKTLLVAGGAGSVGHYAIQMAMARGARVIASVSSETKAAHARDAGAHAVVNYRAPDFSEQVKAANGGDSVDAVLEVNLTANAAAYPGAVKPHGRAIVYGITGAEATLPALWALQNGIAFQFFLIYDIPAADRAAGLAELDALLRAGRLKHSVAMQLPLAEIARAHDLVERGEVMGHVVLSIP
jgi:NADPH2:quinone reductase